jgi:hypothetical protein
MIIYKISLYEMMLMMLSGMIIKISGDWFNFLVH